MSDDPPDVTVAADGVEVRKSLDTDRFEPTAVVFTVRSAREDPVRLRLTDPIPAGVSTEDVGFHADYGADHWSVERDSAVFEREFEPGEEYTTIYGLRGFDGSLPDADPDLALVDRDDADAEAPDDLADVLSSEDNRSVRETISGDRDTLPGLEEGDGDVFDGEPTGEPAAEADPLGGGSADDLRRRRTRHRRCRRHGQ